MKVIDLGSISWTSENWHFAYLACLASAPRNWVECHLEPDEGEAADRYPAHGFSGWWLVMCLDGAPERITHLLKRWECPAKVALSEAALPEIRFREMINTALRGLGAEPTIQVLGAWRDGAVLGFTEYDVARDVVGRVAHLSSEMNAVGNLPWTEQYHVRAAIGQTVGRAFRGLLGVRRDQCYDGSRIASLY